jgi:hypothetical protein
MVEKGRYAGFIVRYQKSIVKHYQIYLLVKHCIMKTTFRTDNEYKTWLEAIEKKV